MVVMVYLLGFVEHTDVIHNSKDAYLHQHVPHNENEPECRMK